MTDEMFDEYLIRSTDALSFQIVKRRMNQLVCDVALNMQALCFIKQEVEERNGESTFHAAAENAQKKKRKAQKLRNQNVVVTVS